MRRGYIDALFFPVIAFCFLILLVAILFVYNTVTSGINTNLNQTSGFTFPYPNLDRIFAYLFIAIYFGIPLCGIILAYLSGGNPIFGIFGIFLLIFSIFISGILKGVIVEILPSFESSSAFINNWVIAMIVDNFAIFALLFGIMILIIQAIS